jgi:hypothetical protein
VTSGHPLQIETRAHRRRTKLVPALLGALLALLALIPGSAAAGTRGAPLGDLSTLELPAHANERPDSVIEGRRQRLMRSAGPAKRVDTYPVVGGQQVDVYSTYYSESDMQAVVNVLGGLVHGDEMNTLSVYLASPEELTYICGQGALACYAPGIDEMIVSGVNGSAYGVPRDYTIAHEYGHHVANYRVNEPWPAIDVGAKRWATYERVCQGVRRGELFPGDEDAHYWENPGEGFAEANAHLNFPAASVPWGYSALLRPDDASLAKLHADITSPWTGPVTVTWNGSHWPRRRHPAVHRFSTPLDGQVVIDLQGPEGSNYDLYLLGPKLRAAKQERKSRQKSKPRRRIIERSAGVGSSERLTLTNCGQSVMRVEVRRRSGRGPFSVTVTRP